MARSYIEYKQNGFWVPDVSMELTLFFVQKTIDLNYSNVDWLMKLNKNFKLMMTGTAPDNIDLLLDKFLIDEARTTSFIAVIDKTESYIREAHSSRIDLTIANSYIDKRFQNTWLYEPHIYEPISLLKVLKLLLEGKLLTTIYDPQFLFGIGR